MNLPIETNVLKLNLDDHSYTFIKPDSGNYDGNVIAIYQDAYGNLRSEILTEDQLGQNLYSDQVEAVKQWLNKSDQENRPDNLAKYRDKSPIVAEYRGYVILAQNIGDLNNKKRAIDKGDTVGFYTIN